MRLIHNDNLTPQFNLAAEEYLIANSSEDIFILWRNLPSVIVGRNQNTMAEINYQYVTDHDINVVRRLSGGGAVFHDLGNVNYTIITTIPENSHDTKMDFGKYAKPIIEALAELGLKAELSGRNDISLDGKKICGNSQYIHKNRMMHHGCILFSAKLDKLQGSLRVNAEKLKGKGASSTRSRVTNISDYLKEPMDVTDFIDYIEDYILTHYEGSEIRNFSKDELDNIQKLADSKYNTWEWNYGKSHEYNFRNEARFEAGNIEVIMSVDRGIIKKCKIFGDFFSIKPISELEQELVGKKHNLKSVNELVERVDISQYILGITNKEILSVLF